MSSRDRNKPTGKPGQRSRKGEPRRQKSDPQKSPEPDQPPRPEPDRLQSLEPDQRPDAQERIQERIDVVGTSPDVPPSGVAAPVETAPIGLRAIANAYGDYTRKSFEETRCFVEQLTVVRSPDKAMKLQTEFARQAYETFVAESQKIYELHSKLARQALGPWQGFVARTTETGVESPDVTRRK